MIADRERRASRPATTRTVIPGSPDVTIPPPRGRGGSGPPQGPTAVVSAGWRGLPVSGAIALALGAGIGGGAIDVLTGQGLRATFAIAFVVGCALAAALVRREGLLAAVIMPPLIYVAVALGAAAVQSDGSTNSWLLRQVFELMTALILGAPVLLTATAVAACIALLRIVAARFAVGVVHLPRQ